MVAVNENVHSDLFSQTFLMKKLLNKIPLTDFILFFTKVKKNSN